MPADEDRARLAEQQVALVRALAGQGDAPDGFDADHVATAGKSLLAKRRRGVEKTWPGLTESLGDRFLPVFNEYARSHSMPAEGHAADGRCFAQHLRRLGLLSDDGRLQLLLAELGRRPIGIAYLPDRRQIAIAFPTFGGARWITVSLPRWSRRDRRADFSQPLSPAPK